METEYCASSPLKCRCLKKLWQEWLECGFGRPSRGHTILAQSEAIQEIDLCGETLNCSQNSDIRRRHSKEVKFGLARDIQHGDWASAMGLLLGVIRVSGRCSL